MSTGPGAVFGSSHAARGPRQEQDGLLTLVGVWSCFGLAVPLQPNIPAVLLRAICVVVVLLVLLQEVTLIVQCLLRQDNDKREEKRRREEKSLFYSKSSDSTYAHCNRTKNSVKSWNKNLHDESSSVWFVSFTKYSQLFILGRDMLWSAVGTGVFWCFVVVEITEAVSKRRTG